MGKRKKGLTPFEKQQKELKKQKMRRKRLAAIWKKAAVWSGVGLVALAMLAGVITLSVGVVRDTGLILRNRTALSSERYEVDAAMLSYYFYETYRDLTENDKAEVSVYDRIDVGIPLKEQMFSGNESWFDFFMKKTVARVSKILQFAEGAADAGMELTAEDQGEIDRKIEEIAAEAKKQRVSVDDYIPSRWGRGVKEKDVRRAIELEYLSDKHCQSLDTAHVYTDAELDAYYAENRHLIDRVDYKYFTLASDRLSFKELKEMATELGASKDAAEFDAWLKNNVSKLYPEETQPTAQEIEAVIAKTNVTAYSYEKGDEADAFLFEKGNKAGDTTVLDNGVECTVYMLISDPKREEYPAVTVRQILVDLLQHDTDDDAKKVADDVFAACKNGMAEAKFIELVARYSEDDADTSGGLLADLTKYSLGESMQAVTDWCFLPHAAGDVGMVKTETYGYHILYYVGTGEAAWKVTAREMMDNEAYDTMESTEKQYEEKYKIETNDGACNAVAEPIAL